MLKHHGVDISSADDQPDAADLSRQTARQQRGQRHRARRLYHEFEPQQRKA
jgi:hypothetical protein